ncbi:MAG: peptidase dimerization domain-containing protein [Actinomycetota bacterium]|nr:peptidase dimerization domain-containing protein [Actinomycetota bacterium]
MPFRSDNALLTAAKVIERLAAYQPPARFGELWTERVKTMGLDPEIEAMLLDPGRIDDYLAHLPREAGAGYLHASTHTTFSPNLLAGSMKTNVIPELVEIGVDVRTLPGEGTEDVRAHLDAALGDLSDRVEVEIVMDDAATISRTGTPLWDSLQRSIRRPFPTARLTPQMSVGFTDARVYRDRGSVAYGAALFSPSLDAGSFALRFHGNDERIDVESLDLTTNLWLDVARDLLT